ncbi:superfamily II DNA or RNA helicase [Bradyrhizobium sp. USDA 4341]
MLQRSPAPPDKTPAIDLRLEAQVDARGILLIVSEAGKRRAKPVSPSKDWQFWRSLLPEQFSETADAIAEAMTAGILTRDGHGLRVPPTEVSMFDEAVAAHLRFPELCPHPFALQCSRDGASRTMAVSVRHKLPPFEQGRIEGSLVRFRPRLTFRIGARLAALLAAVEHFNAAPRERRRDFMRDVMKPFLERGLLDLLWDGRRIDIYQASAIGIDAVPCNGDVRIDPVLFPGVPRGAGDEEPLPLLNERLQSSFVTAFDAVRGTRQSYRIDETSTVLVDVSVQDCLEVVGSLRQKPSIDAAAAARGRQSRIDFLSDPVTSLASGMRKGSVPPLIAHGRYAPHVRGIGAWVAPTFPYLSRIETEWLPTDHFVVVLTRGPLILSAAEVDRFRQDVAFASANSASSVLVAGTRLSAAEASEAWRQLENQLPRLNERPNEEEPPPDDAMPRLSLIVDNNFDEVSHVARRRPRSPHPQAGEPEENLHTDLGHHQKQGISWLMRRWLMGAPSALLADDMGIGKTLQVLVFLDWLARCVSLPSRDEEGLIRHPILVVLPGTLAEVWRKQLDEHFSSTVLGQFYEPTGAVLRAISHLDLAAKVRLFGQQPVTVVSYETLSEHILSIGAVSWAAVVYDELQRLKDPATQLRNAASGLNADFFVGVSGTPIENRIEDLWSVVDAIEAGRLGALRDFSHEYASLDIGKLRTLSQSLLGPDLQLGPDAPPVMLRRFKEDVLDKLPKKFVLTHEREMPAQQALAYAKAVKTAREEAAEGLPQAGLNLVREVRRISLHPDGLSDVDMQSARSLADWVKRSARTSTTFDLLDEIRAAGEKVLLYLDDIDVQYVLAQAIKTAFGLPSAPQIINGRVRRKDRAVIVENFQERSGDGFAPLILSNRVGGVGLHLTRANHVIHVSRWWNPALEEQSNDRTYRMGQKKDVNIHLPMAIYPQNALPSFDRLVDGLLGDKRILQREVLIPPVTGRETRMLADMLRRASPISFATH